MFCICFTFYLHFVCIAAGDDEAAAAAVAAAADAADADADADAAAAAAAAAADRFRIGRRACTAQDRTGSSLPWAETLSPTTSTYKESAAIDRAPSLTGLPARLRSLSL